MGNVQMNLSMYLRQRREDARMTQAELARRLGYSTPQFVSNWERHMAKPPMEALIKMVQLLKLDREQVVSLYVENTALRLKNALKIKNFRT